MTTPAAVTITYEPDDAWPARLAAILNVCPRCIVVDNSVTPAQRERVRHTVAAHGGAELIANPDNPGIGRALNQAFARLHASGITWAIAFDQDSTPAPDLALTLRQTLQHQPAAGRPLAAVGANWRDAARPDHPSRHPVATRYGFRRIEARADLPDVLCVITSGTLFSLAAWSQLGGCDERLFLDLVDTDYCLRARQAGWRIAVSHTARLEHHRGNKRPISFLGRTYFPSFMPCGRLRGLWRNRIHLFRRHHQRHLSWIAYELVYAGKGLTDIILLEDHKLPKLAACLQGLLEGLRASTPKPLSP